MISRGRAWIVGLAIGWASTAAVLAQEGSPPAKASAAPSALTTPAAPIDPYDPRFTWGDTNASTAPAFVAAELDFAQRVADELNVRLRLVETDHFLFFTDVSEREARAWEGVLELTYERVAWRLGVPEGVHLFRGKATVFLFRDRADFVAFERAFYNHRVTYEAGICHQHPTGEVRIAFYRIDHERSLRQLMIHETAHGVIHRFRSPTRIPDWLNEGMAEWTADKVLQFSPPFKQREAISKQAILDRGRRLGDAFWQDGRFSAADYGAAYGLVKVLLRKGRPAFCDFIVRLKDGTPYDRAMRAVYGYDVEELVRRYGHTINIRDLKP
ncbi:MAG: hypothetical protein AAGI54_03980 [Planctomycetota bacterium]